MSIGIEYYEYITKCRIILGDTAVGIEDTAIQQALEDNSLYVYREVMVPQDTLRIEEARNSYIPHWYTYTYHKVWKALGINWLDNVSFIDFYGNSISIPDDGSFDRYTGYLYLTTTEGKRDIRITGTTLSVYRACLYVVIRAMSDKSSYYEYSTNGGKVNEEQWFENLLNLHKSLSPHTEL